MMTTSLVVWPTLAYGLATHAIQDVPVATVSFPNEGDGFPAWENSPPPFENPLEPSTETLLGNRSRLPPKETYPRPTLSWLNRLPRPRMGSVPYGKIITTCNKPDAMALTFDDGPWKYTSDLLDLLEYSGAHATFFVCGGNMDSDGQLTGHGHPRLLRRMVGEGHQVGTHTWGHADLATLDDDAVLEQMLRNEQALVETLGAIPTYFRPPYFSSSDEALDAVGRLGYHVVNAGVDTRDWAGDYDAARDNFDEAVRGGRWGGSGKIVLAHDIHERTVYELAAYMIEKAVANGYRLVTVGECLGDPVRNWYRSPSTGGSWLSRGTGRGSGRGSDRGGGNGRGHGRDMLERIVAPPPDAPTDDESRESGTGPAPSHRLHIHTLPPPSMTRYRQTLAARADEPPTTTRTGLPALDLSDPCVKPPGIPNHELAEWCCSRASGYCAGGVETLQSATGTPAVALVKGEDDDELTSTSTSTSVSDAATAAAAAATTTTTSRTIIAGGLCERPGEGCTPVYKTVALPADAAQPTTLTPDLTSTTARPPKEPAAAAAAAVRAKPTTTITVPPTFQGGQLPPKGFKIMPTRIEARPGGDKGATREEKDGGKEKREKRAAIPYPHIVEDLTSELEDVEDPPRNESVHHRGHPHGEVTRQEGEGEGESEGQGQGQEQEQEHQHEQEQEQQEQQQEHSATINATATGLPVTAEGVRASTATCGLVLAVVNLYFVFL